MVLEINLLKITRKLSYKKFKEKHILKQLTTREEIEMETGGAPGWLS